MSKSNNETAITSENSTTVESQTLPADRSLLLAWLQLMRLPTVFTALSNVLCGFFICQLVKVDQLTALPAFWCLLASGASLYLGGMVLNDVFDSQLDAVERPERPIPSGQISRTAAAIFGGVLMAVGLGMAAYAGPISLQVAGLLAVAVIAYDSLLKGTLAGPFAMGTCRLLNLLLGASAAAGTWPALLQMPQVCVAAALGVYVVGVTFFARNEAGNASLPALVCSVIVLLSGLVMDGWLVATQAIHEKSRNGAALVLGLIAAHLIVRSVIAIRAGKPRLLQQTVGLMLLSIILLDGSMTFALTGDARLASVVVLLVIPARMMRRVIPMS